MQVCDIVGIVTGSASGIGRAIAEAILQGGGSVLLTDVNAAVLQATAADLTQQHQASRVQHLLQDVTQPDSFDRAFAYAAESFSTPVNLLVNCAGVYGSWDIETDGASRTDWERVLAPTLSGVIRGTQVAIEHMRRTLNGHEGVVVNISSTAGVAAMPMAPVYAAAKHGVVGLTRSCRFLKRLHNIRVVALCPHLCETPLGKDIEQHLGDLFARGALEPTDLTPNTGKTYKLPRTLVPSEVSAAFVEAVGDAENAGQCLLVLAAGTRYLEETIVFEEAEEQAGP